MPPSILDRLHRQEGEIVDEADFFLYEGFAEANAGEEAVVSSLSKCALADFFLGHKNARTRGLVCVLRAISHEGHVALLNKRRDVDDEAGAHIGVEAGVDDLEWTVRFRAGVDLLQTGKKAGFGAESGSDGVVRMARMPVRKDNDARAELTQNAHDGDAVFKIVGNGAVGQIECITPADSQDAGGFFGFAGALVRSAAPSGFAQIRRA